MPGSQILSFGPYRLDTEKVQLWCETQAVRLTPKAFQVLSYVVERPGQLVTKEELFQVVWADTVVSDAALTTCIQEIRKALQDNARNPQYLETVHRLGFRFIATVVSSQHSVASIQEGVSIQHSVASIQEAGASRQEQSANEKEVNSVMPAQAGIQEPTVQASSDPAWIPAFAGMTPSPSAPHNHHPSSQPDQALNTSPLPVRRPWSVRSLVFMGLLLLVCVILTVQYLSRPSLSTQDSALRTREAQLPLPDKPSLIVLPFANLSGDPTQEYFSDGVTADITSTLSRLSNLFVISRTSAFTYKDKPTKLKDISREMGVQYVLEGSVRKTDKQLRITVELIDATTDHPLWTEQYDRPPQNLFAVQDEIVHKIVTTLKLQLTLEEHGYIARKHTDNLEAYDALLRGMDSYNRLTKETNAQARQLVEKALALDPQYAEAYTLLGNTYWMAWALRWSDDPQTLERASALAHQALALDDSLPAAHRLLSHIYAYQQQSEQAIAEGERAIAFDPNNAVGYAVQADVLIWAGRPEDALRMGEQALRLNPRHPPPDLIEMGLAYRLTGRYDEAIATLKEASSRDPNFMLAYFHLAISYWLQWLSQQSPAGQTLEPAMTAAHQALTLADSFSGNHINLGYIYLFQQQYDQALTEMERAVTLDPHGVGSYAALAVVLSCVGRTEEALEAATQALRLRPGIADGHLADVGAAYAMAGHYEEARALLQRFLSRYPNILPVHLTLAAVYSELGQEAEARAEAAEVLRINPKFSLEVHRQRAPVKDQAVVERSIAALRKAGLE